MPSREAHVTLNLVLAAHWFDVMASGRKDTEYRAITPYWRRLIWDRRGRVAHAVFHRGYTCASLLRPVLGIDVGPCPYPGWPGDYYRLRLGPVVQVRGKSGAAFWTAAHGDPAALRCGRCGLRHLEEDRPWSYQACAKGAYLRCCYRTLCPLCGSEWAAGVGADGELCPHSIDKPQDVYKVTLNVLEDNEPFTRETARLSFGKYATLPPYLRATPEEAAEDCVRTGEGWYAATPFRPPDDAP